MTASEREIAVHEEGSNATAATASTYKSNSQTLRVPPKPTATSRRFIAPRKPFVSPLRSTTTHQRQATQSERRQTPTGDSRNESVAQKASGGTEAATLALTPLSANALPAKHEFVPAKACFKYRPPRPAGSNVVRCTQGHASPAKCKGTQLHNIRSCFLFL